MRSLIVALNPSIDYEWKVDDVQWEEKNIVQSERRWAGGKGVNVARWLQHLKGESRLLLPLGGETGRELAGFLRQEKLAAEIIPLRQSTRVNVIVTTAARGQLRFNPKGPELSGREWKAILGVIKKELTNTGPLRKCAIILSGGLPRGLPQNAYAQLLHLAHAAKTPAFLDCDGAALDAAVKARPFLIKPNVPELAQWWGRNLASVSQIKTAARALSEITGGWILVSRGRDGALLVHRAEQCELSASAPRVKALNTVGAGDAMLAGLVREVPRGAPPEDWLRSGVAAGTAATECRAGELPPLHQIRKLASLIAVRRGKSSRIS